MKAINIKAVKAIDVYPIQAEKTVDFSKKGFKVINKILGHIILKMLKKTTLMAITLLENVVSTHKPAFIYVVGLHSKVDIRTTELVDIHDTINGTLEANVFVEA